MSESCSHQCFLERIWASSNGEPVDRLSTSTVTFIKDTANILPSGEVLMVQMAIFDQVVAVRIDIFQALSMIRPNAYGVLTTL